MNTSSPHKKKIFLKEIVPAFSHIQFFAWLKISGTGIQLLHLSQHMEQNLFWVVISVPYEETIAVVWLWATNHFNIISLLTLSFTWISHHLSKKPTVLKNNLYTYMVNHTKEPTDQEKKNTDTFFYCFSSKIK